MSHSNHMMVAFTARPLHVADCGDARVRAARATLDCLTHRSGWLTDRHTGPWGASAPEAVVSTASATGEATLGNRTLAREPILEQYRSRADPGTRQPATERTVAEPLLIPPEGVWNGDRRRPDDHRLRPS